MSTATATYTVTGMTCDHCVSAVKGEVSKIDGVHAVEVDLESGRVTVESVDGISDEAFAEAIDEAGFEVAS